MNYIVGRCHRGYCEHFKYFGGAYIESLHWHWLANGKINGGIVGATRFDTMEQAERAVVEILLLHPDWMGQVSIETMASALSGNGVP